MMAYLYWLDALADDNFTGITPPIAAQLLGYYRNLNAPFSTKSDKKDWKRLLAELDGLRRHVPESARSAD